MEIKESIYVDIRRIGSLSLDGIFVFDFAKQAFTYLNASLLRILEINKKLIIEEPGLVMKAIPPDDREFLAIRYNELMQKESLEDVQFRYIQHNTTKLLSCNAYLTGDHSSVVGSLKDISAPREHEEYLINFGARKDAILDAVSQQLSTPLNLSKFTFDLVEKAVKEKKYGKLQAHMQVMREVTSECIRIIDDFLIQEHTRSPEIYTKSNRFDLMSKVIIVLDKIKEMNPDKEIRLRSEASHLFVSGDDLKFFQIIHNIISNAIKFTKENGLIEVAVRDRKSKVEIVISDNGIGIPEKLQPFVFEKNSKAARPGLKGETSTGIGLHVTRKLVGLMRGSITFQSRENQGTKFILEFPKR